MHPILWIVNIFSYRWIKYTWSSINCCLCVTACCSSVAPTSTHPDSQSSTASNPSYPSHPLLLIPILYHLPPLNRYIRRTHSYSSRLSIIYCLDPVVSMKRDYATLLRRLYVLLARPISIADRPGRLYHFSGNPFEYKVGRSGNIRARQRQWQRACPDPSRRWYSSITCAHSHRAGNSYFIVNLTLLNERRVHRSHFTGNIVPGPAYASMCNM